MYRINKDFKSAGTISIKLNSIKFIAPFICAFISLSPVAFAAEPSTENTEIRIPLDAELQRLLLAADKFLSNQDYDMSQKYLERAEQLNTDLPAQFYYFKASIESHRNNWEKARYNYEEYILRSKPEDKYYVKSLEMMTQIENRTSTQLNAGTTDAEKALKEPEIAWTSINSPNNQDTYIDKISKLYLADSPIDALVNHINTLLSSTALVEVNNVSKTTLRIQTSIAIEGTDKIRVQKKQTKDGDTQIMAFSISVYGLSRDFLTRCDTAENKCTIKHKDSLNTWFEIANDEAAAHELNEAIAALVYSLQKKNQK